MVASPDRVAAAYGAADHAGACGTRRISRSLGSLAFRHATEIVHWVFTGSWGAGLSESFARLPWWQRIVVPTVGGAAAGLVLMFAARFVKQQRTTDYMEAVVIGDGILSTRQSLLKSLSALFSISSGASIGREGPLVQLAAMLASALGRIMHVSSPRLRLLVACGAAAGIASAYNAPVSGALFAAEVVMGTTSMEVFGPLVSSSVVATLTIRQFVGADPIYSSRSRGRRMRCPRSSPAAQPRWTP